MSRLTQLARVLGTRGWAYPWYVLKGVAAPALAHRILRRPAPGLRSLLERWPSPSQPVEFEPLAAGEVFARLDGDGFADSSEVPAIPIAAPGQFLPRRRFDLSILRDASGATFVRKGYRGDSRSWRRELAALQRLEKHGVPAPRVFGASQREATTDKSLVHGSTLRDLMVRASARILSRDTEHEAELAGLDAEARLRAVWQRGREVLPQLGPDLVPALARLLDEVHRAGVTGVALTFGNVVVEKSSGQPVFIDYDKAVCHRSTTGLRFAAQRDADRRLFNEIYGACLLTEEGAATLVREVARTNYSPIDLGAGLATRGFWSIDSGTGRWEYLNRRVLEPLVPNARILDLGSHNGLLPLLMLRAGARSVVAVERDAETVEHARRLHQLFEWREMRPLDFQVRNQDMLSAAREVDGPFDLVTAFCSLYYLDAEDMAAVVRRAAELAPVMVLQAKTDTRMEAGDDKANKSSIGCLSAVLAASGFPRVELVAPKGYSRPLLIGRKL